jgi:hypothetical protein
MPDFFLRVCEPKANFYKFEFKTIIFIFYQVEVTNLSDNKENYLFVYNRWLAKDEQDGKIEVIANVYAEPSMSSKKSSRSDVIGTN